MCIYIYIYLFIYLFIYFYTHEVICLFDLFVYVHTG